MPDKGNERIVINEEIEKFACENWMDIAFDAIRRNGRFMVALSGGNTPLQLYEKVFSGMPLGLWERTHIFLTDERCVAPLHEDSNYGRINDILKRHANTMSVKFYPFLMEEKAAENAALLYEESMREVFAVVDESIPSFDLIILGIGEDGHTASLFPGMETLLEKKRFVVTSLPPEYAKHKRLTFTLPLINSARNIFFLVKGPNKRSILPRIINDKNPEYPASLVCPSHGKLFFFLDKDAGTDCV